MAQAFADRRGAHRQTGPDGPREERPMTYHERLGQLHAALLVRLQQVRASPARGQGTVEYVGLILLIAVLIAGVVQASHSFKDTGIAEAVVKKIKGAIDGVSAGR
jgi:hypothetical protein